MEILPIAHIITDFPTKFGVPRQSGLTPTLQGKIVFEKAYATMEAFRGLDEFSHLWLIWGFSLNDNTHFNATVRPPRLGGAERRGVFATRSPFRPNGLALSCLKIVKIEKDCSIIVESPDMVSGTPIYDIKPFIPYSDNHPDAKGGFASEHYLDKSLQVADPEACLNKIPEDKREGLITALSNDPRPAYQDDSARIYGFPFASFEIKFRVKDDTLTIIAISDAEQTE